MTATNLPATDHLSTDAKRQLLIRLARDLMAGSGTEVTMSDEAGAVVVYTAPGGPPPLDPELTARLKRLHTAVPLIDVIADLKRQAARLETPRS